MTGTLTSRATAVCLFAVCRSAPPPPALAGTAGHLGGGAVRALPVGALTAVVQDVPATAFTEEALRQRLADRGELERCARSHHQVVASAAAHADTLPLPLATLYHSEESLSEAVRERAGRFSAALDRVAGREEWGVKVYTAATPAPPDTSAGSPPAGPPPAASGRAYLDRVRDRRRAREQAQDTALQRADRIEAALRDVTVAVRRLRTHGPETTGRHRTQLLNVACLLPRGEHAALTATVEGLRLTEQVDIDVTGPWVPYSFVGQEGDRAG